MPQDYVQEKSYQALVASSGDKDAARKLLVAWAVRDQTLLLGLAKLHLNALANLALEQTAKELVAQPAATSSLSASTLARLINQVGVRQKASKKTVSDQPAPKPLINPSRQAQTWMTIAESFKKKT